MPKRIGIALSLVLWTATILFAGVNRGDIALEMPRLLSSLVPEPVHLPLSRLMLVLLAAGFGVGALLGWASNWKYRRLFLKLQRQNRQLEEELRNLRNLPLEQNVHF